MSVCSGCQEIFGEGKEPCNTNGECPYDYEYIEEEESDEPIIQAR